MVKAAVVYQLCGTPQDHCKLHRGVCSRSPQQQPPRGIFILERERGGPDWSKPDGVRTLQGRGRDDAAGGGQARLAPSAPPVKRPIACCMIRPIGSPLIRPPPVRLQERTCWQALYQSSPPRFSVQEKRARGRSRCGSAGLERLWSGF